MKTVSPELAAHLEGDVLTLATCWRLARRDGVVFRATDHDGDLAVGGEIYRARAGYSRTAVATEAGLAVGNVDLEGVLDDGQAADRALRLSLARAQPGCRRGQGLQAHDWDRLRYCHGEP